MATAHSQQQHSIELLERQHPEWCRQFDAAQRQRMMQEDLTALGTMSLELVSIVCLGFVLIGLTVAFIAFGG